MRRNVLVAFCLALLALAGPALAYTIYLKDGSSLPAKEKYRVEGDRAIITLANGTQTFLKLSEIDVARTEKANQDNLGKAVVIEQGKTEQVGAQTQTARQRQKAKEEQERREMGALIRDRQPSPENLPQARRAESPLSETGPPTVGRTRAGYPDLLSMTRRPFPAEDAARDLERMLVRDGFPGTRVFQGTKPNRALVELKTDSEAAVFDALRAVAAALVDVKNRHEGKVSSLDVLMLSNGRERAGQFELTLDKAEDLAYKKIEPAEYFLAYVQF
ncbi:MAG TPA: hypothetical protein VF017_00735 [Thermoanaerobaculia bacterium]|nr:hypothetical protein [Thermoanaerobaculia bacterium]